MRSILFSIGPLHVYGYGLMIAIGVVCAFTIGCFLAKRSGFNDDALFRWDLSVSSAVSSVQSCFTIL